MSTVLAKLLAPVQSISNQRRQLKQTSQLASILPPAQHTPPAINDFNTRYKPYWPPANIASPSFGSDVAAT